MSVHLEFETKANPLIQNHLNRNPRVIGYRDIEPGGNWFVVAYDPTAECPALLTHEADTLGLTALGAAASMNRVAATTVVLNAPPA